MSQEKRPVGRPRTTLKALPENWEQVLIDCGQEGGSAIEMRCLIGIGESAWRTLLEDSEEFRSAVKTAQNLCEVWWERAGRGMVSGKDGNATVWIFNMKNRFGWRDKQEIEQTATITNKPAIDYSKLSKETLEELRAQLGDEL